MFAPRHIVLLGFKMNMKLFATAAAAVGLALAATPSFATPLVLGSGWQTDEVDAIGSSSLASPLTITLTAGQAAQFSLTDAFIVGDTYTVTLNGVDVFTTTPGLTATPFDNSLGPFAGTYGPAWLNPDYSKIALQFGEGSYSFVVTGDCAGGCPAGLGYRIDLLPSVPEPAAWALMLAGFGLVGATLRSRRPALAA